MIEIAETKSLIDEAKRYSKAHIKATEGTGEPWKHGAIHNVWVDDNKAVCVQYEDGCWWHYKEEGGAIKWW